MKSLVLYLIRFYQKYLSLDQGKVRDLLFAGSTLTVCRFRPYCSEYTYLAIEKYGVARGVSKGFLRILRCNPLSKGGEDPLL